MNFQDEDLIRRQFADWAADALPFHPRSEINHRAWHAWQVATRLERERNSALRQALEQLLFDQRRCSACGHVETGLPDGAASGLPPPRPDESRDAAASSSAP